MIASNSIAAAVLLPLVGAMAIAALALMGAGCSDPTNLEKPPPDAEWLFPDCDQLAERLRTRCMEQAEEGVDCDEQANQLRERCQARKDELCAMERIQRDAPPHDFIRGDVNRDGKRDISDAIGALRGLFLGEGGLNCADAVDANDDGSLDISDAVRMLMYMFLGDREPPPPGRQHGQDPTADELMCE